MPKTAEIKGSTINLSQPGRSASHHSRTQRADEHRSMLQALLAYWHYKRTSRTTPQSFFAGRRVNELCAILPLAHAGVFDPEVKERCDWGHAQPVN